MAEGCAANATLALGNQADLDAAYQSKSTFEASVSPSAAVLCWQCMERGSCECEVAVFRLEWRWVTADRGPGPGLDLGTNCFRTGSMLTHACPYGPGLGLSWCL